MVCVNSYFWMLTCIVHCGILHFFAYCRKVQSFGDLCEYFMVHYLTVYVFILQTEIGSHEPRIRAVCDNGVQMIDNGESSVVAVNCLLLHIKSLPCT